MIKIAFMAHKSPLTPAQHLNEQRMMTPNHLGIWKNIQGVDTIKEADYYIVLDGIPKFLRSSVIDFSKIISFQLEPNSFRHQNRKEMFSLKDKLFGYFDYENYGFPVYWWNRLPFEQLETSKYNEKSKQLGCMMTTKTYDKMPAYKHRLNFLDKFIEKYGDYIEVYGWGTENKTHSAFKGPLNYNQRCNYKAFKDYKYSFLCENSSEKGHFTPRIIDAMLNWCIPIYWGATNIYDFFPKSALHTIDIYHDNIDKLYQISQMPITKENIEALKESKNLIMYKYNLWEKIYKVINNVV